MGRVKPHECPTSVALTAVFLVGELGPKWGLRGHLTTSGAGLYALTVLLSVLIMCMENANSDAD